MNSGDCPARQVDHADEGRPSRTASRRLARLARGLRRILCCQCYPAPAPYDPVAEQFTNRQVEPLAWGTIFREVRAYLAKAVLLTLPPGAYTAIVSGAGGGTGVGMVEVFPVFPN